MKNPPWNIDELIVTLDFYFQYAPNIPQVDSSEIKELSDFLKKLASKTNTYKTGTFRNVNGVSMKLMNFRRFDPSYSGVGLKRGAKSDEDVWNKYSNKRDKLKKISRKIKLFVESDIVFDSESEIEVEGQEGKILTKVHKYRERDKKLVRSKKMNF